MLGKWSRGGGLATESSVPLINMIQWIPWVITVGVGRLLPYTNTERAISQSVLSHDDR